MTPKQKTEFREQIETLLQTDSSIDHTVNRIMNAVEASVKPHELENESLKHALQLLVHACHLKQMIPLTRGLCSPEYIETAEQLYRESVVIAHKTLGDK